MSRLLLGVLGLVLAAIPDRVIEWYESIAVASPDVPATKPWLPSVVRAEGIAYVAIALVGGRAYAWTMGLVGAVGAIAAAIPERYLAFGARIGYDRPGSIVWRDRFVSVVRAIGVGCVLLAIRATRERRS